MTLTESKVAESAGAGNESADLGQLLVGAVNAVLEAQDKLDGHAATRVEQAVLLPDGTLQLPPLWFTVEHASIEVHLAATVRKGRMQCRLVNPASVGLFGYAAASGTRVQLTLAPRDQQGRK